MKINAIEVIIRYFKRQTPVKIAGATLAMTLLSSCTSAVYDVRQIQQPVVLNNNPFLAPGSPSSLKLAKVDTYSATVYRGQMTASAGNTTASTISLANEAQLNAFDAIGGQANRTICDVSLDIDYLAFNGLFVLADKATIQATGDVAEFQRPVQLPLLPSSSVVSLTNRVTAISIQPSKE